LIEKLKEFLSYILGAGAVWDTLVSLAREAVHNIGDLLKALAEQTAARFDWMADKMVVAIDNALARIADRISNNGILSKIIWMLTGVDVPTGGLHLGGMFRDFAKE